MKLVKKRSGMMMKITFIVVLVGLFTAAGTVIYTNLYEENFFADKKFEEFAVHEKPSEADKWR